MTSQRDDSPRFPVLFATLRDKFAMQAPKEAPYWFKHVPAPNRPEQPTIDPLLSDALTLAGKELGEAIPDTREHAVATANYRMAESHIKDAWVELAPKMAEYRNAMEAWKQRDHLARATQWAYAWADAMMNARSGCQ